LSANDLLDILCLRQAVFVLEQECLYPDIDGLDPPGLHLTGVADGSLVAYLRAVPPGHRYPAAAIGRVVVHPEWRGQGLGEALMRRGIALCQQCWPGAGITISAQSALTNWYHALGFRAEGPVYDEDGIPHQKMHYDPVE
jgi:ElaA protein